MPCSDVDLLRRLLRRVPALRLRVRLDPPSFFSRGQWRRLKTVRLGQRVLVLTDHHGCVLRLPCRGDYPQDPRGRVRLLLPPPLSPVRVVRILEGTDRLRQQSSAFLRILLRNRSGRLAAILPSREEAPPDVDRILCAALCWWDRLRHRELQQLLVLVPESWARHLQVHLPALRVPFSFWCYRQVEHGRCRLWQLSASDPGESSVGSPFQMFAYSGKIPSVLEEIRREYPFLDLIYRQRRWELAYRGLPVVWQESGDECLFDWQRPRSLCASALPALQETLREVLHVRTYPPVQADHPCYRYGVEKWLESLLLKKLHHVNPSFSSLVYSQVPTHLEGDRKILDLLTVTTEGRLAVLEIKAEKELRLLFQGLHYWRRVDYHRQRGDFEKAGYFQGVSLAPEPPLLYLISPLFEFHRVLPRLFRYLDPRIPVVCVGVNSDWRRRLKFLRKFQL